MKWKNFLEDRNYQTSHKKTKIDNLNSLIDTKEYEFLVKTFHTNKTPELDGFTGEFYQAFKDK